MYQFLFKIKAFKRIKTTYIRRLGPVAQWLEHTAVNRGVVGSIPSRTVSFIR